jgi:hypothetical protein
MENEGNSPKRDTRFALVFTLVLLGGFLLRRAFFAASDFPLHDGGLFYVMIGDLIRNGFHLPIVSSYNAASIPFLYPPLGLYAAGWIETTFGADRLQLFRWIPLVLSTAAIPAFYFLAKEVLKEKWTSLGAMAIFSVLPMSYTWVLMGGGVTRAFGEVLCILALAFVFRFLRASWWVDGAAAVLLCGFTVLSHPEWAWFLFYSIALISLAAVIRKPRRGVILSVVLLLGTLLVVSPWLIIVLRVHGGMVSLPLLDSGFNRGGDIARLITLSWSNEPFFPFITLLGILGSVVAIRRRQYLLPIWLLMVFCLQGRAADQKAVIPLALVAGVGLAAANDFLRSKWPAWEAKKIAYGIGALLYGFLFLSAYLYTSQLIKPLPAAFHQGVAWIKDETPPASTFMVITGETWERDNYSEWIAALTGRASLNVVQGYEWLPGFSDRIDRFDSANLAFSLGIGNFLQWMQANDLQADYLVMPRWQNYGPGNYFKEPALHWEDWVSVIGAPVSFENDALMIVDLTKISNP